MVEKVSDTELASMCEAGIDTYIRDRNKEVISNRITEGMTGAVFATALYLLFGGYKTLNYKMVLAPFVAGAGYAFVGAKQATTKETDYRIAFNQVCSNMRTEDGEDDSE